MLQCVVGREEGVDRCRCFGAPQRGKRARVRRTTPTNTTNTHETKQGAAGAFVTGIEGCFYSVVGFPVNAFGRELLRLVRAGRLPL